MNRLLAKIPALLLTLMVGLIASSSAFATATIVIQNADAAGVGFNDPSPPVPGATGNSGATLGDQRLIAFQAAANIWGATLVSGPTITIRASWSTSLTCGTTSGVLGSAGATSLRGNFTGAVLQNAWYSVALANALHGIDLNGATAEINAQFNSNVGTSGCLTSSHWYYGLDGIHGNGGIDLVTVLLHEFGHGLGFQSFTDESTGIQAGTSPGFPSVYDFFLLDKTTGKHWPAMTDAERKASAINASNLVWDGPQVTSDSVSPVLTTGKDTSGHPLIYAPSTVETGSSVSHWDKTESPNQLMEPNISNDLTHSVSIGTNRPDLTFSALRDVGWCSGCAQPPPPSPTPTPSPPPNDNFANAQVVSGCSGSVTGSNLLATKEVGEPTQLQASSGSIRSVWYQWQSPSSASVTIDTEGSDFDTILSVYTGSSVGSLSLVANGTNDDVVPGSDVTSSVTISVTQGTIYRIAVNGYDNDGTGGDTGNIKLNWSESPCSNSWQPTTLTSGQVVINTWTFQGRTSAYVKLLFPDAGYRVSDWGQAILSGNDFTANATVEKFNGTSVQALKTTAQIYDLGPLATATYNFNFKTSGTLANQLQFTISGTAPAPNPIDGAREFVRWQYKDFLSREPDVPGWDHWTGEITLCSDPAQRNPGETEAQCVERKRANTSAAFFLSPEFQNTGYFVLRVYRGSLGRMPLFGGSGDNTKDEFTRDAATVSAGIVVNNSLSPTVINSNKQAFVNQFVTRGDFLAIYGGLTNTQYVDTLFQTTGITPTTTERNSLISEAGGAGGRASVLFKVVDGTTTLTDGALRFDTTYGKAFYDQQFNPGFVQMEYFGYMRRDPDDGGYAFWLGKLNQFGNFVDAQMVLAFIASPEYRARFGQP
jgi:hypothetical protein